MQDLAYTSMINRVTWNQTNQLYRLEKSSTDKIVFISQQLSKQETIEPLSVNHLFDSIPNIKPSYLFVHIEFPIVPEYYSNYAEATFPTILVFFNIIHPSITAIPCIACYDNRKVYKLSNTLSLSDIWDAWDSTNLIDLKGGLVKTGRASLNPSAICGFTLSQLHIDDSRHTCILHHLGRKYNFTFKRQGDESVFNQSRKDFMGFIGIGWSMSTQVIIEYPHIEIYNIDSRAIHFVVVTRFPNALRSIWGFFTPFDSSAWWSILFTCVGISLVLQFEVNCLSRRFSGARALKDFVIVQALLFGQPIDGEIIRNIKNKQVQRLLWGIWLFVCFILMENLYKGRVYSDLTVLYPPKVPKTFDELVAANMTILTTSQGHYTLPGMKDIRTISMIKEFVIPEVLDKNFGGSFGRFVTEINSRIVYIHGGMDDISVVKNISKFLKIGRNQTETKEDFAIMDFTTIWKWIQNR